jgi:hypothetical protein
MRYLTLGEVVELHQRLLAMTGGASGIRDLGLLESALAQPKASFGGVDLHPTVVDKAPLSAFRWWLTIPLSMAISGSVMLRWSPQALSIVLNWPGG